MPAQASLHESKRVIRDEPCFVFVIIYIMYCGLEVRKLSNADSFPQGKKTAKKKIARMKGKKKRTKGRSRSFGSWVDSSIRYLGAGEGSSLGGTSKKAGGGSKVSLWSQQVLLVAVDEEWL